MEGYLIQGKGVLQYVDNKEPGYMHLPTLETDKRMSFIDILHLKALAENLKMEPLDIIALMGITDARKESEKPQDDWLQPIAVVAPVEEPKEEDVKP